MTSQPCNKYDICSTARWVQLAGLGASTFLFVGIILTVIKQLIDSPSYMLHKRKLNLWLYMSWEGSTTGQTIHSERCHIHFQILNAINDMSAKSTSWNSILIDLFQQFPIVLLQIIHDPAYSAEKGSVLRDHDARSLKRSPIRHRLGPDSVAVQEVDAPNMGDKATIDNGGQKSKKKVKQRVILPGGHDIRLTSQVCSDDICFLIDWDWKMKWMKSLWIKM